MPFSREEEVRAVSITAVQTVLSVVEGSDYTAGGNQVCLSSNGEATTNSLLKLCPSEGPSNYPGDVAVY